ncbi:MAG: hypothetical protein ACYTGV_04265 [Planctomycetota bacterium]
MARLTVAGLLLFLAACSDDKPEPPVTPPVPPERQLKFVPIQLFDWQLALPKSWLGEPQAYGEHGRLFLAPRDDRFKPSVHLWWKPWNRTVDQFFKWERAKRDVPENDARIVDEGRATVAGLNAHFLIYHQTDKDPETREKIDFLTVDWYFVTRGRAWILRGISTARTFNRRYLPIFEQIKKTLRYNPQ